MAANFGKIQAWGWSDGDDQWGSDVNNNFASVDRRLDNPVKGIVSDPSTITGQVNNDRYIVGVTPGGDFAGETNRIAYWSSVAYGGSDTWKFYSAPVGLTVSLAGGANYTLVQAGSSITWIRTSTAYVRTWGEFKIAMQSSSFDTVFIDEEMSAPVDDLITVAGYKRVEGKPVSIENTTLTLNSGSVDFHGEFHIGNNAGSAGLLTGDSAIIRFRRVVVPTQSEYTGTGVASYEHASGIFTGAVQQFWDNTSEAANVDVSLNRTLTLQEPTATDNVTIFRTDVAITVQEVIAVSTGTSPSTTYILRHSTDRSAVGNLLTTSGTTTSTTSGDIATLSDSTIPADSWIWLETSAVSGSNVYLTIDIKYTED